MDPKTIEAMSALGVDITPDAPTPIPSEDEIKKAAEELKNKENGVEIKTNDDEPDNKDNDIDKDKQDDPVVINDTGDEPIKKDEDLEPKIINDDNPELKTTGDDVIDDDESEDHDLDAILKSLEEMSKESLDDPSSVPSETKAIIDEKMKKAEAEGNNPKKQAKTLKEIADLNVKLQQELALQENASKLKEEKILELANSLNELKLDDSKEVVPNELKGITNYFKKFRETSNEAFKIKAIQEAVDVIENLTGKPLKGNYLDDYIEDDLKKIEATSKKQYDEISRSNAEEEDPTLARAKIHGVGI